ncbi:PTS system mannose/fructose/N-acetylgalactosamine-transporter subunit IIB [Enterococcus faecalis]|uniref:PTS system mannose/fructose/N-acetylgalactosamine-transporter subunit IIB n=1 Tax=Enterococcus faecalis TaxID=1351 RepID=UPI0032DEB62D
MEGIIHIRIDDRLIHGQVAAFWSNILQATRIMVINDEVANDDMQKKILRMAAPTGIATSIITKEKALKNILAGKYKNQRVFVIFKNPEDILELMEKGLPIQKVNVGNMGAKTDTVAIKKSVNITEKDRAAFEKLMALGVQLTARMVPDESDESLSKYLG